MRSPRPVSFIADFTAIHGALETDCSSIGRIVFIDVVFTHNLLFSFKGIDNVFFPFFFGGHFFVTLSSAVCARLGLIGAVLPRKVRRSSESRRNS